MLSTIRPATCQPIADYGLRRSERPEFPDTDTAKYGKCLASEAKTFDNRGHSLKLQVGSVMNIGIFGGTFNPIHNAHLRIAEESLDQFGLSTVIFVPAADPPHKPRRRQVSFAHRLAMAHLATQDNPCFSVSGIEGERPGKSYSIDTLRAFQERYPDGRLFFVMGSDSFAEIGTWHEYPAIFATASLIVVGRPGSAGMPLVSALPVAIADQFCYDAAAHCLTHCSGTTVSSLDGVPLAISSSSIRELLRSGRSVRYLMPDSVERYLKDHALYA
jgi:nicotinate-nucleotide adenylyltransferase